MRVHVSSFNRSRWLARLHLIALISSQRALTQTAPSGSLSHDRLLFSPVAPPILGNMRPLPHRCLVSQGVGMPLLTSLPSPVSLPHVCTTHPAPPARQAGRRTAAAADRAASRARQRAVTPIRFSSVDSFAQICALRGLQAPMQN